MGVKRGTAMPAEPPASTSSTGGFFCCRRRGGRTAVMQLGRWKLSRTRSIAVAVAAMAVGVVSCDSSDAVTAPGDAPEDVRIVLSTDSVQLADGDTVELKGSDVDGEGRLVSGARITWISSDTAIATVTSDGKLISRQEGSVDVSASAYSIIERLRALIYRAADRLQIAGGNDQKGAAGKQLATPLQEIGRAHV